VKLASGKSLYNYFRDYQPCTGRYGQSDPLGILAGLNTYAYVGNNPVHFRDSKGLCGWTDSIVGFGDALGAGLIRRALGISNGNTDVNSGAYISGRIGGAALGIAIFATTGIPPVLTHFTTAERAISIAATGLRAGGPGLFGRGIYATTIGRPLNLFIPAGSNVPISVLGEGFFRIIPGFVYLNGGSATTAAWAAAAVAINVAVGPSDKEGDENPCGN